MHIDVNHYYLYLKTTGISEDLLISLGDPSYMGPPLSERYSFRTIGLIYAEDKKEINYTEEKWSEWVMLHEDEKYVTGNIEDELKVLKRENDNEYIRAQAELRYCQRYLSKYPNDESIKSMLIFMEKVNEKFETWYYKYCLEVPELKKISKLVMENKRPPEMNIDNPAVKVTADQSVSEEILDTTDRSKKNITDFRTLSPDERDVLREKIIDATHEHAPRLGSDEKAFIYLADHSMELFGMKLTKHQVQGQYKRHKDDE